MSDQINKYLTGNRAKVSDFIEGKAATRFIITLILINAAILGLSAELHVNPSIFALSADDEALYNTILRWTDMAILALFSVEMLLKFYAYRMNMFRSGWNLFDTVIVLLAWVPTTDGFSVLRAFRVFRVLRGLSLFPAMRRIVSTLITALPGVFSVIGIVGIVFYVCSILATELFGAKAQELFGSVISSSYTLFQVMTLDNWSAGVVKPVMEIYPWAWLFFVPFVLIMTFALLNLFIGAIMDAIQMHQRKEREEGRRQQTEVLKKVIDEHSKEEIKILKTHIESLHDEMGEAIRELRSRHD